MNVKSEIPLLHSQRDFYSVSNKVTGNTVSLYSMVLLHKFMNLEFGRVCGATISQQLDLSMVNHIVGFTLLLYSMML